AAYGGHVAAGPTTGAGVGVHQVADQAAPGNAPVTTSSTSVTGDGTESAGTASTDLTANADGAGIPSGGGSAPRPGEEFGIPIDDHAAHTASADAGTRSGEEYGIPLSGPGGPMTGTGEPTPATLGAES